MNDNLNQENVENNFAFSEKEKESMKNHYEIKEANNLLFIGSCIILSRGGITTEQAHQWATQLYNIIYTKPTNL